MVSSTTLVALGGLVLSFSGTALAGFASYAQNNIAVYWGQNSANRAGSQQRLGAYCSNTPVNIIPLAFLNNIKSPTLVNFASASDSCTPFPGSQLLRCPEIEADILSCQSAGKTLLLSLGGATYTEGGFSSPSEASAWADTIWAMFGPVSSSSGNRPFGGAVVDGFDFDFEAATQNMVPFASRLRTLMDAETARSGRRFFLAAAPQCPFPDLAMDSILESVPLDFVSVQFYNNYCGAAAAGGGNNFNFGTWDAWASARGNGVKVLLGVPGSPSAAGSGYVSAPQLVAGVIAQARRYPSFGGVMVWDMSQLQSNPGFLETIAAGLDSGSSSYTPPAPVVSSWAPAPTTLITSTRTSSAYNVATAASPAAQSPSTSTTDHLVPQWGQCGGEGYTGSTTCQPPFTCVHESQWWAHCD
ncbi:carbohydrate-binding module family 1 protein [Echria macrotheca]|uniref:chitinase n=1 Tax=Echria macrotheca TaxID=438768 RepID=A0AAJ0BDV7_9PEZI|nr:carbohydrate-binding module family 1 protein [Echria macrotheca]